MDLFTSFEADFVTFALSAAIVAAYYFFLNIKVRDNPTYTIHGVNALARSLWVESVMSDASRGIMAVQTLRNFIMASSLMASTAALLIIGTLTLSGQAGHIAQNWHILSINGSFSTELWILKVMLLLVVFIVAFFAFAMSVRLTNHVVFMLNVPEHNAHHNLSPKAVARRMQRAGSMFAIGMRAFFFAVPLVFWLFGPYFLLMSSIGLVITLYRLDRSEPEDVLETRTKPSVVPRGAPVVAMQQAKYAN
ncbi:MAG: DUF599 domain-containing protein [Thiobacillus sp.]